MEKHPCTLLGVKICPFVSHAWNFWSEAESLPFPVCGSGSRLSPKWLSIADSGAVRSKKEQKRLSSSSGVIPLTFLGWIEN